ncbi:protein PML isoform X2 [Echinops telfairi]|uniref:Protein PML isoform X2 n=1 Tax=Echinops telfairi TaxID=9371 RepID=A0AC55CNI0_ECHTE|nr:protein PML isoform X2 [Echinops telfairi]
MLPAMIVSSPPDSRSEGHRSNPSPMEQSTEEEFQFLHCQRCKSEAKCPKLLPCLHTLCSKCQQESDLQCPICQAPCSHILDNIFFQNLQQNLSLYRQIRSPHAACTRCKESADFWCFECQQLLCAKCFEAHQWFVKHEAHPLADFESQPVHEFLERMRKFNIFCSNPRHKSPELTSIYCRGCAKPLCCSCALLDTGHSQDKRDICTEIQQRQEELDTMAQALQVQEGAFAEAHARMATITSQLDSIRKDTEKLIRSQVSEVVEQVLALERELLQSVEARFELDNQEIAKHLGHLDAVLQRIRTGGTLVQKMKGYASGQEVLDMHSFLCEALRCLSQEEPQSLKAPVSPHSFEEFKDEFKERLKTLVSSITWEMDEAQPKRANPEAASTPGDPFDVDLTAVVEQQAQEQALRQAEAQPMAVVQQEPGAHPVPLFAFSIKDPSLREEVSSSPTAPKRKSCQTESPRKVIKMESEEGKEVPPEQPRHRTSTAVSAPHSDGPSSPRSPTVEREVFLPNNHEADQPGEAEERVVVISSSEDSDAENSASHLPHDVCSLPAGPPKVCSLPAGPPYHPPEQVKVPEAWPPSLSAGHLEPIEAIHRGISFPRRRAGRCLRRASRFPIQRNDVPSYTHTLSLGLSSMGPPSHAAPPREGLALQRATRLPRRRGRPPRISQVSQWIHHFFSLPSTTALLHTSIRGAEGARELTQNLGVGDPPGDSRRAPQGNP